MTTATASDTAGTSATELVERARALVPALRSRQAETDRLSKAPDTTVAELEAAGLFSMTVPRVYGGQQASMSTWMEANAEIGRGRRRRRLGRDAHQCLQLDGRRPLPARRVG